MLRNAKSMHKLRIKSIKKMSNITKKFIHKTIAKQIKELSKNGDCNLTITNLDESVYDVEYLKSYLRKKGYFVDEFGLSKIEIYW